MGIATELTEFCQPLCFIFAYVFCLVFAGAYFIIGFWAVV
jgi:hypothetical protein